MYDSISASFVAETLHTIIRYMGLVNQKKNRMNPKILEYYKEIIDKDIQYLKNSTIRTSLESYKEQLEKETAKIENEHDRNHNLNFLKSFYNESISVLEENESDKNEIIKNAILELEKIKSETFVESICEQLLNSIEKFKLKEEYESFNGLFFEFDSSPSFSGIAFKEPKFEIILHEPKYIEFEDGSYACDYSLDFELEELFKKIIGEEFEKIAWQFEFELDIFQRIKNTVYNIVAINLHEAIHSQTINKKLNELGFEKNGIVYLNEHDMEVKSVYVNE